MMRTPIWTDQRYAAFFRGADAAIVEARRTRPAADVRTVGFRNLLRELFGADAEAADDQAAA